MSESAVRPRPSGARKPARARTGAESTGHTTQALPAEGRLRAVIEAITPQVDCGRFPIKRTVGERVSVEADCFTDGHDVVHALLRWRHESEPQWHEDSMQALPNDRWRGEFLVERMGRYMYTVAAWVDSFRSWRHDFGRRLEPADIQSAALAGAELIGQAAERAESSGAGAGEGSDAARLRAWAERLRTESDVERLREDGLDAELAAVANAHADRRYQTEWPMELAVTVDRERARYSTWYELFPRSASLDGRHGTFDDVIARLPYVAGMGFDVLYLPPIHPVGRERRKGPNNTLVAGPEDVGSPWAIGAREGGHKAVHSQLGTLEDFRRLIAAAADHGLEVAMDIAYQCAPDHPYVEEHPQWFRHRPDGSVQYAENPPKKYQDIYPFNFESDDWAGLWDELRDVIEFWIAQGVQIFRVDNPHTKAFPFWEWAIGEIKRKHPATIFLAEAFTRPKVMHRLAKLGFTQSYTYFAWRNSRYELTEYFTELTRGSGREYFRPNVWPNTPDILTEYLQFGGRGAFMARVVLASTLAASYGIYGPAFELMAHEPREPGSEEYRDSEKYQIHAWDLGREDSLAELIGRLNQARRDNPALQFDWNLTFHDTDNEAILCYSKRLGENVVLALVNLDPYHVQSGWTNLDLAALGIEDDTPYQAHELLSGGRFLWRGARNFFQLDPNRVPAHVFRLRRKVRTERDFDYFL